MAGRFSFLKAFTPEEATRALYKNWREHFILILLRVILALGAVILIAALVSASAGNSVLVTVFILAYALIAAATLIPLTYEVRVWLFLGSFYLISMVELARYGILGDASIFFMAMIVFATMLLSPQAGMLAIGASVLSCLLMGLLMGTGLLHPIETLFVEALFTDWVSGVFVIVAVGVVVVVGFRQLEREFFDTQKKADDVLLELEEERAKLEEKVQERTIKLRRFNEIGRTINSILDPDELLARATSLIADEFECYFAAIFFVDVSGQWAELREATGDAGKIMHENKFHLDLRGKSLTSAAIRMRQVRVGLDVGPDAVRFDNPMLPHTRSQISVPLAIGERVIGALELHSAHEAAFLPQEADTYQNLVNQIAVAYENARLFKESQQSLAEMQATQRQYLQGSWSALASERRLVYEIGDRESVEQHATAPLALRDQIIGQIQLATHEPLSIDQRNLIEAIATQAALALENARLVEESQSIATRERLANDIISKVWTSVNMESILQTTVRELGRALEAAEVEIQVSMETGNE